MPPSVMSDLILSMLMVILGIAMPYIAIGTLKVLEYEEKRW